MLPEVIRNTTQCTDCCGTHHAQASGALRTRGIPQRATLLCIHAQDASAHTRLLRFQCMPSCSTADTMIKEAQNEALGVRGVVRRRHRNSHARFFPLCRAPRLPRSVLPAAPAFCMSTGGKQQQQQRPTHRITRPPSPTPAQRRKLEALIQADWLARGRLKQQRRARVSATAEIRKRLKNERRMQKRKHKEQHSSGSDEDEYLPSSASSQAEEEPQQQQQQQLVGIDTHNAPQAAAAQSAPPPSLYSRQQANKRLQVALLQSKGYPLVCKVEGPIVPPLMDPEAIRKELREHFNKHKQPTLEQTLYIHESMRLVHTFALDPQ